MALLPLLACAWLSDAEYESRLDQDGDGHGAEIYGGQDCDDADPGVYPGADEHCDGRDEDCSGTADENAVDRFDGYLDADGDGWGNTASSVKACDLPSGYALQGGDCDDEDAAVSPGAEEDCATAGDDDCDGDENDEDAIGCSEWYEDQDGDGYGGADARCLCGEDGAFTANVAGDCDDGDPGAGACSDRYLDRDGDGYGVGDATCLCEGDAGGMAETGGDCDDTDPARNPGAAEVCDNGADDDCDGGGCEVLGTLDLSEADARRLGEEGGDQAGWSVSGAGDLDGDGKDDLLVGACTYDGDWGAVYVVLGPASGTRDLSAAGAKLVGEAEGDFAGWDVAAAGDLDADGLGDAVVGAYLNDAAGEDAGAAYVLFGPLSGEASLAAADARLVGEEAGDYAGASVAGAGDVDADGGDDLLVGAVAAGGDYAGAAYLVLGPVSASLDLSVAAAKLTGENDDDLAGGSVSAAGDVDADGHGDVLVGTVWGGSGYAGIAYLVLGLVVGTLDLSQSDARFVGEEAGDRAGFSVSGAGDVDADGKDDLLVGAWGSDAGGEDAGAAYLVLGPATGTLALSLADARLDGEEPGDLAGFSVAGAGDVDADGRDDLLVGAYANDTGADDAGAACLVLGPVTGTVGLALADAKLVGESAGDAAGFSVAGAGDVDGNGRSDLFVGAPGGGIGTTGVAYLLLSRGL